MSELREAIQEDELRAAEVEEGRQHFLAVARRGLLLRRAVAQTCLTDHMYEVEPEVLRALFGQALELAPASLVPSKRVANLVRFLTAHTYAGMARGLRRPDRVLLAFLVAVAALRAEGAVAPRQWAFFTRGPLGADPELDEAQRPPWLPPARWPWVWQLDGLEGDLGLVDSMINHGKQWQVWLASENRCHLLPPLAKPLTSWQRLLLMRAMGDRMLIKMATIVIGDCLGPVDFDLPMDVAAAFAASGPLSPLLFLLGEGIDVLPFYLEFAKDRGRVEKQDQLCAGEALMAAKAEDLLHQAVRTGRWVFLQNVHLDVALLEVVRKVMQDLTTKEVHPEFRLWLSSVPTQSFPSALARPAIRLVPQWPTGLRAQLQHVAQTTVARDLLDDHALGPQGTRLVLSLVHFQGLCLSRNRAGHMGWAAVYHWAAADFAAAYRCWQPALHRPEGCWAALRAAAVDLVYGGRVPFADDQRCLAALFDKCFPEGPTAGRLPTADVHSPATQPQGSALQELLGMFPGEEVPEDLGLCDNSMLLMLKAASERLVTGAAGQAAPGGPPPDRYAAAVVDVCDAVLRGLPPAAKGGGRRRGSRPAEAASPLLDVLLQLEVATFNAALAQVQQSAMHLRDAVHQSGCSADMMETCDSLYQHRVPRCWHQHGYPGWMPLGQWLGHLRACGEALQRWLDAGPPDRFWVPGFAAPLRLFAVALQAYAQRTGLPVGDLRFRVEGSCSVARTPPVLRVDGLRLYGASWDAASNSVTEQKSGTLYAPVPTLQLLPVVPETASPDLDHEEVYPCPLYYTAPARLPRPPVSPALACVELPTPLYEPGRWALRRVQLLCHAPAEAEAEGAAEDAAWLRPPPPDPAGDSPSPAPA